MNRLAGRRIAAYALDMTGYLGIAAATVPLGLLANRAGLGESRAFVMSASAVPVVIATAVATRAESGGATWGKRRLGLGVEGAGGGPLPVSRALGRNALKIAVPWQLGHVVAIGATFGGFERPDPRLVATAVATYAVIGVGLWGVLRRSGVTLHDAASGSRVVTAQTG
ncbi:RDD family protein [Georgenia alba]|uniref:RDD family protein n=1 Tax=Georgenia alba TaxID=2233858 RepID=A0ABW2Q2T9_9MICO